VKSVRAGTLALAIAATFAALAGCTLLLGPDGDFTSGGLDGGDAQTTGQGDGSNGGPGDGGGASDASADAGSVLSPYALAVLADKPVFYLRLDDSAVPASLTAAQLFEEIGQAKIGVRDGTVTPGVPGALTGPAAGTALELDTGYIQFGDRLGFSGTVSFSLELWVRSTSTSFSHVITKQDRGTPKVGYAVFTNGGSMTFERYAGSVGIQVAVPFPADSSYHHIVAVFDGDKLELYIDGAVAGTQADARPTTVTTSPLILGTEEVGVGANVFQGSLDEVAIYDHVLLGDRIAAHIAAANR
jgi:trimeric autotransporter adhesin